MADKPRPLTIYCMPRDDWGALFWLNGFASSLASRHEAVGVQREAADNIAALAKAFDEAYFTAKSPASNTKRNIELKTLARNAAVLAVRQVIETIKSNPQVTAGQIIDLGLDSPNTVAKQRKRYQDRVRRLHGTT